MLRHTIVEDYLRILCRLFPNTRATPARNGLRLLTPFAISRANDATTRIIEAGEAASDAMVYLAAQLPAPARALRRSQRSRHLPDPERAAAWARLPWRERASASKMRDYYPPRRAFRCAQYEPTLRLQGEGKECSPRDTPITMTVPTKILVAKWWPRASNWNN